MQQHSVQHQDSAGSPLEALLQRLRWESEDARRRAAQDLSAHGPAAVPHLCAALEDPEESVRVAAAESLGQVGDERAVGPLSEALRRCFIGGSRRAHLLIVFGVATAVVLAVAILLYGIIALKIGGGIFVACNGLSQLVSRKFKERQESSRVVRAISEALAAIAERSPTPELRQVLPDLRAVTADVVQQQAETRASSREAAARIESLTERLKCLPLAAAAPTPDAETLPRPADAPSPDPEKLPRV